MTNTIVDAGTDAKIARMQKRGIELIDVAILEPVEVWGETGRGKTSRPATPDFAPTAYSSAISLQSHSPYQQPSQLPAAQPDVLPHKRNIFGKLFKKSGKGSTPPASPTTTQSMQNAMKTSSATATPTRMGIGRSHTRNLSASLSPSTITGRLANRSPSPNPPVIGLGLTVPEDNASVHSSNADHSNTVPSTDEKVLRPPILGIQPAMAYAFTFSNGTYPGPVQASSLSKNARALMYVWFVRKWLKRKDRASFIGNIMDEENGGLLGKMRGSTKGQGSLSASAVMSEGVEVRFEWRRHVGKVKARRGRLSSKRSRGSLFVPDADGNEDGSTERDRTRDRIRERDRTRERDREGEYGQSNRLSVISHQSMSTNVSFSEEGSPRGDRTGTPRPKGGSMTRDRGRRTSREGRDRERDPDAEDDGEDSEPEDSETPWVCTLKIRKAGAGTGLTPATAAGASASRTRTQQGDGVWVQDQSGTPVRAGTFDGQEELGVLSSLSQPQVVRVKVGTLSPTPHHPKIVAMLKVPFPLPDVEVERMGVRKRPMGEYHALFLSSFSGWVWIYSEISPGLIPFPYHWCLIMRMIAYCVPVCRSTSRSVPMGRNDAHC
jgi:hypothetical protein